MIPKASATAIVFATAWLGTLLWAWTLLRAKARMKRRFEEQQIAPVAERERLQTQVQDQAALLDLTQDALCVHDVSGQIRFWNRGAERMFGWQRDEIVGQDVNGPLFALNSSELAEAREKFHLRHEWSGELRHRTRAGAEVVARHHWTLVRDATRASPSILVACTDVTQNRKLEAQFLRLQRVESIGALAGGIAHDLNNVLAPILMSVQLLRDVATDDSVRVMLDTMETSAQRGASILRQLLTFVRGMEGERGLLQPKHLQTHN